MSRSPDGGPPRVFEWVLRQLVPPGEFGGALIGDLREEFEALRRRAGRYARWWYRYQAMRLVGRYAMHAIRRMGGLVVKVVIGIREGEHMGRLVQDVRYAVRMLRKRPGFAITVVFTLALGIGANTAIFSVVNAVLLRPLPYPDSDRIVSVWGRFLPESGFDFPQFPLSEPEYIDYRDQNRTMSAVALFQSFGASLTDGAGDPERVPATQFTSDLFRVLQIQPRLGRPFTRADDAPGNSVVLLSDDLWRRRFGADASVIGSTISIGGRPVEVVGVMPPGFDFPSPRTQLWMNYQLDEANPGGRQSHNQFGVARLAPGVTLDQAHEEMATLMTRWRADWPDIHTGHFLFLRPRIDDIVGDVRTALVLVLGAVGFVLLIVCANVANLLLARGEHRRREIAVRGALGAGRRRIFQQLLTESVVVSALGGALGLAVAVVGTRALLTLDAGSIPRAHEITTDGTVLLFSAILALATSLLFGLLPAVQTSGTNLTDATRENTRGATASASRVVFRKVLVGTEMALSVLLVVGAGLMIRSFSQLLRVDPGFRSENVLVAQVSLPGGAYTNEQGAMLFTDLLDRLNSLPGVRSASAISNLPILHGRGVNDFRIAGRPVPGTGEMAWNAAFASPRVGYFETMGVPLRRGRLFDERDNVSGQPVAIINETLATQFFPGQDPLGQQIRMSGDNGLWRTIVGVVGDVKYEALNIDARAGYYFPNEQALQDFPWATRFLALTVRTDGDPLRVAGPARATIADVVPGVPIVNLRPMADVVHESVAQPRFIMTLLGIFAAVALVLGAVGIYGVMAYGVAQRTGEIGIRIALGARARQVVGMVVGQGMRVAVVGVGVGLAGAVWLTRFMRSQLFEVSATDPVTYAAVAVLLVGIALIASYLPARRAARVPPVEALRMD